MHTRPVGTRVQCELRIRRGTSDMVRFLQTLTLTLLLYSFPPSGADRSKPSVQRRQSVLLLSRRRLLENSDIYSDDGLLIDDSISLVRHERSADGETTESPTTAEYEGSKTLWEKIEEFYANNNNLAMYCVLPLMVLVYGGCSVIYCVYKLRKYIRRRKHKRFQNEDDSGSFTGNSSTNLLQNGDHYNAREKEGVKTVSGGTWLDDSSFSDVRYEETKKSPLPWDTPHKIAPTAGKRPESRQDQKIESFILSDRNDRNSGTLEREREKLDEKVNNQEKKQEDRVEAFMREKKLEEIRSDQRREGMEPVKPVHKAQDFNRLAGSRPIEIVPITQSQYQRHMESQDSNLWDPLHNKPFDVRAGSGAERRAGRESAWSIRDEIMAKYDALTSLAMAKKTADILRLNSDEPDAGHRPDTLRRKPRSKSKLLFIAE